MTWPAVVTLAEARRGLTLHIAPDAAARADIALMLDLEALERLEADLTLRSWLDGVEIEGRWRAEIVQICGVSLDPFQTGLSGALTVRAVPPGSPNAAQEADGVMVIDLEAEDPPDELESERIDLAAYIIEHLALEIDPFPRKPGVEFEPPTEAQTPSPFAALKGLKRDDG